MRTVKQIQEAAERAFEEARLEMAQLADTAAVALHSENAVREQAEKELAELVKDYAPDCAVCMGTYPGPEMRKHWDAFATEEISDDMWAAWTEGYCSPQCHRMACAEKGKSHG